MQDVNVNLKFDKDQFNELLSVLYGIGAELGELNKHIKEVTTYEAGYEDIRRALKVKKEFEPQY